ncbi:hypothetical protein [Vagococcus carniphilus]|uniref:hypothetical protein n=2 Tax=Vagococcus carniphilus TaxID=218144 RepID=UPI00288F9602|nr:hypothetical protein [Vagococcus carniphilus]MDT2815477.1 hypothetical protein [Vagococcus carniphilus]MDT2829519.1 hypothetical protein [Vagococcus carniphilus]MDT2838978.1 hypothetical protein [Vagococcus carniphilus]MDT2853036.1 hypothetical protein [Vagococcus carniphilus]MDT2864585.1 hypothetical protein [Vagococcus carniphilus]
MRHMKKSLLTVGALLSIGLLSACSNSKDNSSKDSSNSTSISQPKETVTSSSSEKELGENAEFKAEISEEPVIEGETVSIILTDVKAIKDPKGVNASLSPDGVVLIAEKNLFDEQVKIEDLAKGDELDFTLIDTPAMTKSIPPQISGDSIIKISLAK